MIAPDPDFDRFADEELDEEDYDGDAVAAEYAADAERDLQDERAAWGYQPGEREGATDHEVRA
jgi:hypothetical protein